MYSKLDRQKSLAGGGGGEQAFGDGGLCLYDTMYSLGGVGLISDGWRSCSELGSFFIVFFLVGLCLE